MRSWILYREIVLRLPIPKMFDARMIKHGRGIETFAKRTSRSVETQLEAAELPINQPVAKSTFEQVIPTFPAGTKSVAGRAQRGIAKLWHHEVVRPGQVDQGSGGRWRCERPDSWGQTKKRGQITEITSASTAHENLAPGQGWSQRFLAHQTNGLGDQVRQWGRHRANTHPRETMNGAGAGGEEEKG